jgi:hypothetical protein
MNPAEIARWFELPLSTYYASVTFRTNLLAAGYLPELVSARAGMAIGVYGRRLSYRVVVYADQLIVEIQSIDGGRRVETLCEPGEPDFRRAFSAILRCEHLHPTPLRQAGKLWRKKRARTTFARARPDASLCSESNSKRKASDGRSPCVT